MFCIICLASFEESLFCAFYLSLVSNLAMYQDNKYNERLKCFSKISVLIGGVLLILGIKILFPTLGEE